MRLRTEIEIPPFVDRIDYSDRIFTIGSCFAQSIGSKMSMAKLHTTINPTGTLFNPLSICDTIARLSERRYVERSELREGNEGWYHLNMHSSLNGSSAEEALHRINSAVERGGEALASADWVVITLGTAWLYERADNAEVVANCHKEPASNFVRRRASLDEIVERLDYTIREYMPQKRVLFTLSPIRHIADGLSDNSLSKATLRLSIAEVIERDPHRRYYLPAYEMLVDDLRDYRFYGDDMVHPSSVAVEYIWERFAESILSERAKSLLPKVMKIVRAAAHRPTNPGSEAHKSHCRAQLRAIEELKEVTMEEESYYFRGQLKINL